MLREGGVDRESVEGRRDKDGEQSLQPPICYISNIFQPFQYFLAEACLLCSNYAHFGVQSSVFLCKLSVFWS